MTQVAIALMGTPLTHSLINDGTAPDVDRRILPKGYEILQSRQANEKKHMTGSIADVEKKAALDARKERRKEYLFDRLSRHLPAKDVEQLQQIAVRVDEM